MNTKQLIAGIIGALMLFCTSAVADYSGDQPLTKYERGMTHGDLVYVAAPPDGSCYTSLDAGDIMTQVLDISAEIPDGATIKTARLYNYVTWSTSGDPAEAILTFNGVDVTCQNTATSTNFIDYGNGVVQYWDTKGLAPSNYPSGTFAWDVTSLVVDGLNTAIIANADSTSPCNEFVTYGFGLLVVYDEKPPTTTPPTMHRYWILEGADMLYGDSSSVATTSGSFEKVVPNYNGVNSAELTTVVVSCDSGSNSVFFNGNDLGPLGTVSIEAIGVDTFDVTPDLLKSGNIVEIQDSGDYMVASNAFLVVDY